MSTYIDIPFEEWVNKYNPITDRFHEIRTFETYGEDLEELEKLGPYHVWTYRDGDEDGYISNGWGVVNRLCYYATEVPWNDGEDIVVSW